MLHAVSASQLQSYVHLTAKTIDHLTSDTSSSPLSPEELKSHLALVDRIDRRLYFDRSHLLTFRFASRKDGQAWALFDRYR